MNLRTNYFLLLIHSNDFVYSFTINQKICSQSIKKENSFVQKIESFLEIIFFHLHPSHHNLVDLLIFHSSPDKPLQAFQDHHCPIIIKNLSADNHNLKCW